MFKSHREKVVNELKQKFTESLDEMGEVVVQQIKSETPVITGNLRDGNEYEVHSQTLFVRNLVEYAKFVELGTYKQHSNPFMRRGIMNSKSKMLQILLKKCKV